MLTSFFDTDSCKNHSKEISRALRKNLPIWQKIVSFQGFIMVAEICLDGNQGKLVFQFSIFFVKTFQETWKSSISYILKHILMSLTYFIQVNLFHT